MPKFVLHEHSPRTHHFDLRLERDGVLKSWPFPKGLAEEPGTQHPEIQVEDHPLEYQDFEGVITEGHGEGEVLIWVRGTYIADEWTSAGTDFELQGQIASGRFALVPFKRSASADEWLWIEYKD